MIDLKSITGDRADQKTENGQNRRIAEGVPKCKTQVLLRDQRFKVFNQIRTRNQFSGNDINTSVCRRAEHIVQRKNRKDRRYR